MEDRWNENRQKEEGIKCSPYWDKFLSKETKRNLEKLTSCHWGKKILKMRIKQVFLPILLLLSFEIGNNSTLTFAKQQKSAGFHYITGQFFFYPSQNFRGPCNLLVPARGAEALHQPRRAGVLRAHGNWAWLHYSPRFICSCRWQKIFRHPIEDPTSLLNYYKNSL